MFKMSIGTCSIVTQQTPHFPKASLTKGDAACLCHEEQVQKGIIKIRWLIGGCCRLLSLSCGLVQMQGLCFRTGCSIVGSEKDLFVLDTILGVAGSFLSNPWLSSK